MPRLAINTFALDARLGRPHGTLTAAGEWSSSSAELPRVSLIDLPRECSRRAIELIELRAAHLPRIDDIYLTDLRATCSASDVELFSVAIDDVADLAHEDPAARYEAVGRLKPWIDRAAVLRARHVRLASIPADADAARERLADSLGELAEHAKRREVRLLLTTPSATLLAALDESLRKLVDVAVELDGARDRELLADASRATLLAGWRSRIEALLTGAAALLLPADFGAFIADPAVESNISKTLDVLGQAIRDRKFTGPVVLTGTRDASRADEWERLLALRDELRAQRVVREAPPAM